MRRAFIVSAWAGAALGLAAGAAAAEIDALGGVYREQVEKIRTEADHGLVVRTPNRGIPLALVKAIRFQELAAVAPDSRGTKLVLTNGDYLRGDVAGGDDFGITVRSRALGETKVSLDYLWAVIPETSPERERALVDSLDPEAQLGRVRVKDSGEVTGVIELLDQRAVVIDTDVPGGSNLGRLDFRWDKVEKAGLAILEEPPEPTGELEVVARLVDGSSLSGRVDGLDDGVLRLVHPLGGDGPLRIEVERIAEIVVHNGAFQYLSDVDPVAVDQHFPPGFAFQVEVWGYKRDRNVSGGPLRLGGRVYDKGLGVHSYCALTYDLGGEYRDFKATIGLDDSTRYMGEPGFGAVVFKVLVDGRPVAEHPDGIVKRKGEAPTELSVDLSGAQELTIVADFDPTSLHVLGRADWADAHLIKKR